MDGQHWIKKMGKADPLGFGDQAEQIAVAVKTPGTTLFHQFEPWLIVPIEEFVGNLTGGGLVCKFNGIRTKPLNVDDRDEAIGQDAAYGSIGLKLFEMDHEISIDIDR